MFIVDFDVYKFSYIPPQYHLQSQTEDQVDKNKRRKNLLTLVRFAASMMQRLQGINKDAFQEFQLRVGNCLHFYHHGVVGFEFCWS